LRQTLMIGVVRLRLSKVSLMIISQNKLSDLP
jgi:hypothetical protein